MTDELARSGSGLGHRHNRRGNGTTRKFPISPAKFPSDLSDLWNDFRITYILNYSVNGIMNYFNVNNETFSCGACKETYNIQIVIIKQMITDNDDYLINTLQS